MHYVRILTKLLCVGRFWNKHYYSLKMKSMTVLKLAERNKTDKNNALSCEPPKQRKIFSWPYMAMRCPTSLYTCSFMYYSESLLLTHFRRCFCNIQNINWALSTWLIVNVWFNLIYYETRAFLQFIRCVPGKLQQICM